MSVRAIPTLLKVGFAEAATYRTEMIVWVLSTTMPLVMMLLWTSIADTTPVTGRAGVAWNSTNFISYFLSVFVVRQLVAAWAAWEINFEVRNGTLALKLLRPLHPIIAYASSNLSYLPLRALVTLPVVLLLVFVYPSALTHAWWSVALIPLSIALAWCIAFFINVAVGALSFTMESSLRLMDLYFALFFVFSGYLVPVDLFPDWLERVSRWLPFRYVLSLPVDLVMGRLSLEDALVSVAAQLAYAVGLGVAALLMWRRGVTKFQAFGG